MHSNQPKNIIIFKSSFSHDLERKFLTKDVKTLLNQQKIDEGYSSFCPSPNLIQIFQHIQEAHMQHIGFAYNNFPQLITAISGPVYCRLITLSLRESGIDNIESLAFMNMDQIKAVNVTGNKITQIKAFNKTRWPQVQVVEFGQNEVSQFKLERMKMNDHLQLVNYGRMSKQGGLVVESWWFFTKLEPDNLVSYLHGLINYRKQNKVCRAIAKKYRPFEKCI